MSPATIAIELTAGAGASGRLLVLVPVHLVHFVVSSPSLWARCLGRPPEHFVSCRVVLAKAGAVPPAACRLPEPQVQRYEPEVCVIVPNALAPLGTKRV